MNSANIDATLLENIFENYKKEIETSIEKFIENQIDPWYREETQYILQGGKRLRGTIILLINDLLNGDKEKALSAATAIEIVHSASLALDDIIDVDLKRRGKKSAWVAFGIGKTILITNIIIPKAVQIVYSLGELAVKEVISTWINVSRGELFDSFYNEVNYQEIIELKTSKMYELAFILGALSANQLSLIEDLRRVGNIFGKIYQILDDYIDTIYMKEKGEKEKASLERFHKWIGINTNNIDIDALTTIVKKIIIQYHEKLKMYISNIENPKLRRVLEIMPYYMINKLSEESRLNLSFI